MKVNKWTTALASAGVIGGAMSVNAEESPIMTALSSTTISGYVDTAMHWNPGTGNANPAAYGFNNSAKMDGFNLNAVNLQIGKALDEGQWAAGYHVDLLFGPNAAAYGNNSVLGDGNSYASDFAIKQAYVELRAPVGNGIDFKVGVFDTVIGYEVAHSVGNPNYTRSYGWSMEPTQHTGVLASYQINDMISVSAGVANTLAAGINNRGNYPVVPAGAGADAESQKTWLGSVAVTAPEDWGWFAGSTLYGGAVYGWNNAQDQYNLYAGATMTTPIEALSLGVAWDYAGGSANDAGGVDAFWNYAFGVYASYQVTENLGLHARGEYAAGDNFTEPSGDEGDVFAATLTAEYQLWENVVTRAEVRWDHASSDQYGGRESTGGAASKENDFLAALQVAYLF